MIPGALLLVGIVYDLPRRLLTRDLGPGSQFTDEAKRAKAINNVRTTLFQGVGGAALLIGLFFTARQVWLTNEGQITDRYTKAIAQLGNNQDIGVRVGAIYALERIGKNSLPPDRPDRLTIVEVLSTFVRTHSSTIKSEGSAKALSKENSPLLFRAPDVQAAMTVLGRNEWHVHIDLHGADIHLAGLHTAEREGILEAFFDGADFRGADLRWADLRKAHLVGADFVDAPLSNPVPTHLEGADLRGADLRKAHLSGANLNGAKANNDTSWPKDFGKTDEERRETAKAGGVQLR